MRNLVIASSVNNPLTLGTMISTSELVLEEVFEDMKIRTICGVV